MLKIGIVGCGKIADQHVHAIRRIPDCEIVALCDREPLMAKQLGERFGISGCFSELIGNAEDRLTSMSFILPLRHRAIIRLPKNASNLEATSIWKNLSRSQPVRRRNR